MPLTGPIAPLNREAIYSALFAIGWAAYAWKNDQTTARRLKLWGDVPSETRPAFFQFEGGDENYSNTHKPNVIRKLPAQWVFYMSCKDPSQIGSSLLNPIMDALEKAILPTAPTGLLGQTQTLGGLVSSVNIEGSVLRVPGDLDGDAMVMIPLVITCP